MWHFLWLLSLLRFTRQSPGAEFEFHHFGEIGRFNPPSVEAVRGWRRSDERERRQSSEEDSDKSGNNRDSESSESTTTQTPEIDEKEESVGVFDIEAHEGDEETFREHEKESKRMKLRDLEAKVGRWKQKVDPDDPDGCGYPICVILDGVPTRFRSFCNFSNYLLTGIQDHTRRVFHIQKGDCADVIEGKGHGYDWGEPSKSIHGCRKCMGHEACGKTICWAHNGEARTFNNICSMMEHIHDKRDIISAWISLDNCQGIFSPSSCINTEWFDIDNPCGSGDAEISKVNLLYVMNFKKSGQSRMCSMANIEGPMIVRTSEGGNIPDDQVVETVSASESKLTGDRVMCENKRQTSKPKPPNSWPYSDVMCRDYKVRHCCKNLFQPFEDKDTKDNRMKVVTPEMKTLFDECEWRPFISNSVPFGVEHEQEDRASAAKHNYKKHVCGMPILNAAFIDARTREDDIPFYETGEKMTKVTPTYGLLCSNINNKDRGKKCSDYKVRYCCLRDPPAEWGPWGPWGECTKSCNVGSRKATRMCEEKKGNKITCFGNYPGKNRLGYRQKVEPCNELPCPEDAVFDQWRAWSPCSTTCGDGTRRRFRGCTDGKYKGQSCPDQMENHDKYFEQQPCPSREKCPLPMWSKWGKWSSCSLTCGMGIKRKDRTCIDMFTKKELDLSLDCIGGKPFLDEKCKQRSCRVDGGLTPWQAWEECNVLCGPHGKRIRRRYCTKPMPAHGGKDCSGPLTEYGECDLLPNCPVHCTWSLWGGWSECSLSCGPKGSGFRQRYRHVSIEAQFGGKKCDATDHEEETCKHCSQEENSKECINFCPIDCVWTEWNVFQSCPKCYEGSKQPSGYKKYLSHQVRSVKRSAEYGGKKCNDNGVASEMKTVMLDCTDVPKCLTNREEAGGPSYWTPWTTWTKCIGVCGSQYMKSRNRVCEVGADGESCKNGKEKEKQKCAEICPPKGWAQWESWSNCPVTCGKATVARRRPCLDDMRTDIEKEKKTCRGTEKQTRRCDKGPCAGSEVNPTEGEDPLKIIAEENERKYREIERKQKSDQNQDRRSSNESSSREFKSS